MTNNRREVSRIRHLIKCVDGAATAALVTVAGCLSFPTPASATSWNETWTYLHFPPTINDGRFFFRWITTGPGHYRWQMFNDHQGHPARPANTRRIYLCRASYQWVDCWEAQSPHVYRHYSRLNDESFGGQAVNTGAYVTDAFGSGTFHLGSTLDRVH